MHLVRTADWRPPLLALQEMATSLKRAKQDSTRSLVQANPEIAPVMFPQKNSRLRMDLLVGTAD
jgi:hypothetical protein